METAGQRRGLDKGGRGGEKKKGRGAGDGGGDRQHRAEGGKILDLCLCVFIHGVCVGTLPGTYGVCVCVQMQG